ncbi:recombination regulator RecX [Pigmentiphaga soli]|uniref:Regulatory protein RecX n=1 Tax=Pigmentiphaga soli TaxID=1007095 RepID=A0ABP8HLE0_9BURK
MKANDAASPPSGLSLKARAVGYLSRREHSRAELERKLARHAADEDDVRAVLDSLEKEGWLSNERFAQSLVHRLAPKRGAARIVQELRQHGIDTDQVSALRQSLHESELPRARDVWRKRFKAPPADANERAKQIRFLMARGFSQSTIRRVLGDMESDDADSEY